MAKKTRHCPFDGGFLTAAGVCRKPGCPGSHRRPAVARPKPGPVAGSVVGNDAPIEEEAWRKAIELANKTDIVTQSPGSALGFHTCKNVAKNAHRGNTKVRGTRGTKRLEAAFDRSLATEVVTGSLLQESAEELIALYLKATQEHGRRHDLCQFLIGVAQILSLATDVADRTEGLVAHELVKTGVDSFAADLIGASVGKFLRILLYNTGRSAIVTGLLFLAWKFACPNFATHPAEQRRFVFSHLAVPSIVQRLGRSILGLLPKLKRLISH